MEKQKQSLYFPEDTLREISREANRLDRSLSWTVQQAWRIAREEIRKFPESGRTWTGEAARDASASSPRQAPAAPAPRSERDSHLASAQVREFLKGKFDRDVIQ